jgi:pimeloyl-ACP methyl ester carboxylesterase
MRTWMKVAVVALAALVVVGAVGFYGWTRVARYAAFPEAAAVADAAQRVRGWYVFAPEGEPLAGFVFYPGGLVDPAAYAPWMRRLADGGALAVIVPMPLDLAVFGIGRAAEVVRAFPRVDRWAIGGHSLGGAMAAEFVKGNPGTFSGIALLASYPAESTDLSALPIQAVSTYGTRNGVTPPEGFEASLARLPAGTELVVIDGGNHAQFGHYGPQTGDGVATIDREEQQRQTAETVLAFLEGLR